MSAEGDLAKAAAGAAVDIIGDLIRRGLLNEAQRAAETKMAEEKLLRRLDPKLLGKAYAAARAKGPKK